MRVTARILIVLTILVLAGRANGEERWRLKFEHEAPRKILVPPHVPPGLDVFFGQKAYWYVLYRVTNVSEKTTIGNGNPVSMDKNPSGPRMCLKIWIETDDKRRLVRPFVRDNVPGVEGMKLKNEKEYYPSYDEAGARATWGGSNSIPFERFRGAGACYVDGFFPNVHDYIAEKHAYKPKFNPSIRYEKGPNAALPVLADCFDVNEPLKPGETRTGCAIFADFPMEEYSLFYDALNLISVFSEERRTESNSQGFEELRMYRELFPEGKYIKYVNELLKMENASRGSTSQDDPVCQAVGKIIKALRAPLDAMRGEKYKNFSEEITLLTNAARNMIAFKVQKALENLETFRTKYKKSEHYLDADRLYTFGKRNLIPRAREEAEEILRRHDPTSLPDNADRLYLKVRGLMDPVLKEGNMVYADEPILVIFYHRPGDASYRALQPLTKVEERWIPGKKRLLRKIARTRVGDY